MDWRVKAKIQKYIAVLPSPLSYKLYYYVQRRFGGLKSISPVNRLKAGFELCEVIRSLKMDVVNKDFLEVGTGRRLNIPIALYLCGANNIYTVDINPYLEMSLIKEDIVFISKNKDLVKSIFKQYLWENRLQALIEVACDQVSLGEVKNLLNIKYYSPCSASDLPLDDGSIDYHISYTVFEHINKNDLVEILREGNRVINKSGLFIHLVDFTDHFSHSDKNINRINFLKYDDFEWRKFSENIFMYMNRLRVDDYEEIYNLANQEIIYMLSRKSIDLRDILVSGNVYLDEKFINKSIHVLSTVDSWIVSRRVSRISMN